MSDSAKLDWLRIAFSRCVVMRALCFSAIVGSVLIVINHHDCCLRGHFDAGCLSKSLLMPIVPYLVSTFSSVHAILQKQREGGEVS